LVLVVLVAGMRGGVLRRSGVVDWGRCGSSAGAAPGYAPVVAPGSAVLVRISVLLPPLIIITIIMVSVRDDGRVRRPFDWICYGWWETCTCGEIGSLVMDIIVLG